VVSPDTVAPAPAPALPSGPAQPPLEPPRAAEPERAAAAEPPSPTEAARGAKRAAAAKPASAKRAGFEPPAHWPRQLAAIRTARAAGGPAADAPVDRFGCLTHADPTAPAAQRRFQTLVGLVLSPRTRDEVTAAAFARLGALCGAGGVSAQALADAGIGAVEAELVAAGVQFPRNKARHLAECAALVLGAHGGEPPRELASVMALPGVGPKVAHLFTQAAWGETHGVAVDSHVQRIAGRLGWAAEGGTAERARKALESWLPADEWRPLNPLLVGFGQTVCGDTPRCDLCPLAAADLCPSARSLGTSAPRAAPADVASALPGAVGDAGLPSDSRVLLAARIAHALRIGLDASVLASDGACDDFIRAHAHVLDGG
jgi:endonuclease-3